LQSRAISRPSKIVDMLVDRRLDFEYLTHTFNVTGPDRVTQLGEDALSQALAAMAHTVRRDLLVRVRSRPTRVTDLAAGFDISLPAVSRHLKVLEAAGLVTRSIEGRDHFIAASPEGWRGVAGWVETQSAAWNTRLQALKALLEARDGDA
jgi:DNA-binding transcriptional ArsR family regulator